MKKALLLLFQILILSNTIGQIADCPSTSDLFFEVAFVGALYEDNDKFYFFGDNGINGTELWISDGTENGTYLLKDLCLGPCSGGGFLHSYARPFVNFDGFIFFIASDQDGKGLWKTDGTPQGTIEVKEFDFEFPWTLLHGVYFNNIFIDHNEKLYISDGTESGTYILNDVHVTSEMIELNGKVYFEGNGDELWVTDGTTSGTSMVKEVDITSNFFVLNNRLLFYANAGTAGGELWTSDGTENGTDILFDINQSGTSGNYFLGKKYKDKVYFSADDGNFGQELWVTDGTQGGTNMIADINRGAESSNPQYFTIFRDKLFFQAENRAYGRELWMTDGTEANTVIVDDFVLNGDFEPLGLYPRNELSVKFEFFPFNGKLFLLGKERGFQNSDFYMLNEDNSICKINEWGAGSIAILNNRMYFTITNGIHILDLSNLTSLSENNQEREVVKVSPNPASATCVVKVYGNRNGLKNISIYNSTGVLISHKTELLGTDKVEIDLSSIPEGLHYLVIRTNDTILTKKLVVNKD